MRYVVDLNFWHLAVRAVLPTAADADHFRFQFRAHLTARDTSPDVTLRFSCGGSGSWCEALLNPRQVKTVEYSLDGSGFVTYETWLNASRRVSPLPPIPFMERSVRPYAAHAACAEVPAMPGKAAVITGASGGGKTSLLLYLLDAGWAYAADDLLPFRNGKAWTYLRTMNVRHHTLTSISPRLQGLIAKNGRVIRTRSGETFLVHPADLGFRECSEPEVVPVLKIELRKDTDFLSYMNGQRHLVIQWNPVSHRDDAVDSVARALEADAIAPVGTQRAPQRADRALCREQ